MSTYIIITVIGLLFVFEGFLPFLSPKLWRILIASLSAHKDKMIRLTGLMSMLVGTVIIILAHYFL